jgi:PPK2 family polyphosphate:nucleotide phosphotransferase
MSRIKLAEIMQQPGFSDRPSYERSLEKLQLELLTIQQTYFRQKRRAILVFEGPDAAGKGGVIKRLTERLDPRGIHVWPIGPPNEAEKSQHYLARFWQRLPGRGSVAVFDRSWYGRVLVERVEKFATQAEWRRAYEEINQFEAMLSNDGARLVKCFLWITKDEQRERFIERLENPYKRWKITPDDIRNREKWDKYVEAFEDMLERTSPEIAPWHVIPANKKWYARVEIMKIVIETLRRGVDVELPPLDPELKRQAAKTLGVGG